MIPIKMEKILIYEANREKIGWSKGGLPRAAAPPHDVHTYTELLQKVAALAYYNKQFSLLFRWQSDDFKLNSSGEGVFTVISTPPFSERFPGSADQQSI